MIEETENQEQSLEELIERVEQDDLPTNVFTIEDTDPMVLLGKINEVIGYLRTLQGTIESSDTKATQALETAITALETANSTIEASATALSRANTALSTANTAISSANNAVETANNASTTANNAESKATEAKQTAEGIAGTANQALTTAQNANTTANSANSTANNANTTAQQALNAVQGKQDALNQNQLNAVNSGINATKVDMFYKSAQKGRASVFRITSDMNIGVNDTQVTNLTKARGNPDYNFALNNTNNGVIVPAGVFQIKITSIMSYLPKSNNESFNNVIKINGADASDRQAFIYVQAPVADLRTSLTNIAVVNVSEGDIITFVTKAPLTDTTNPAKLQVNSTHFIIEITETIEES